MPNAGRHDAEGVERLHAPLHELVALAVALELELHVEVERLLVAVMVDHHRVVDDEVDRHQRLDGLRVLAHRVGDVAHCREVRQQRNAGEVLQHDARDDEWNLVDAVAGRLPAGQLPHVLLGHLDAVAVAQHGLEHDADRNRQARDLADAGLLERGQAVVLALPGADREVLQGVEQVVCHRLLRDLSVCSQVTIKSANAWMGAVAIAAGRRPDRRASLARAMAALAGGPQRAAHADESTCAACSRADAGRCALSQAGA